MLRHCCEDLLPFNHKRISEVGHWCWAIRGGSQSTFQFIQKVFDGVVVRTLCRPVKFFHTDLDKPFLYGPRFVHGAYSCWTGNGLPQTFATKLEGQNCLECHCMLYHYDSPLLELRGQAQTMKISPRSLFLQTLHLALCIGAWCVLLAYAKPRFVGWTVRCWSVIHHSREQVSNARFHWVQ